MFNLQIIRDLKKDTGYDSKILLYQSSCSYHKIFQKIPFDAVILSSDEFSYSEKIGKVYCIKSDNNFLLATLREHDIRINSAVFIRDGCQEGGNYECTNTASYFGRLLPLLTDSSNILTDHGTDNGFFDTPVIAVNIAIPDFYNYLIKRSLPINDPILWQVQKIRKHPHEINLGNISLRILHDSIFDHLETFDLIVLFSKKPTGYFNYFGVDINWAPPFDEYFLCYRGDRPQYVLFSRKYITCLYRILRFANENRITKIGFIPFGNGKYEGVFRQMSEYRMQYPKEISLFHLNKDDFGFFYSLGP
jgi:hypothetical protein